MSRRRIYLMRHADVAYFAGDGRPFPQDEVPITSEGRRQAAAAARALAGARFDRVVTSGLRRTVETATVVAPALEAEAWPELRELRAGRIHEIPEDELEAAFTGAFRGRVSEDVRFLGGESIGSLLDRVLPAVGKIVEDETWDTALAVLHGGVNRAILSHALTGGRAFLGGFEQAPACINILDIGVDWIVRCVNFAPYDPAHTAGRGTTMEALYEQYLPYRKAKVP